MGSKMQNYNMFLNRFLVANKMSWNPLGTEQLPVPGKTSSGVCGEEGSKTPIMTQTFSSQQLNDFGTIHSTELIKTLPCNGWEKRTGWRIRTLGSLKFCLTHGFVVCLGGQVCKLSKSKNKK